MKNVIAAALAEQKWKSMTPTQRKAHMRKMTEAASAARREAAKRKKKAAALLLA